jgi:galactose mutarotase-like enzyme
VSSAASTLTLFAGRARAVVVPAVGGSLASFTRDEREVLKSAESAALHRGDVLGMACYPLVPYSNRIAHGRLDFDGDTHLLAHSLPGVPHAIHGVGWQRPWQVAGAEASRVRLTVYDVLGREVKALVDRRLQADRYEVMWDGTNNRGAKVASGIYFYRIDAGKHTASRKMVLLR